jgi:GMP synthase-like glutamine amidotransferase
MRIHVLQHVPFEGPASIGDWAAAKGFPITRTRLFDQGTLPDLADFDWVVAMGGPMGVADQASYPWLEEEKGFIREAITDGKTVVGVCLGAQMIAAALGANVYRNPEKEIGWLPIELTEQGRKSGPMAFLPQRLEIFQWHGDTFDLPAGAVHLARSEACEHQAFLYEQRVLGLQFHLESTPASVEDLVANCAEEMTSGRYVQDAGRILAATEADYGRINQAMTGVLERLASDSATKPIR